MWSYDQLLFIQRGGERVIRTILITECEHVVTKEKKTFYGRYDPVTLARGCWKVVNTYSQKYSMSDEEFVKHAKVKEK